MNNIRVRAIAAASVTAVTLACGDIPILPQWSADLYAPIGGTTLSGASGTIPANTSVPVTGQVRSLGMEGTAGDILNQVVNDVAPSIRMEVRLTKTANLAMSFADTLVFAADQASLATSSVRGGILMGAAETALVDTLDNIPGLITLLQQVSSANGTLWMQAQGQVTTGASPVTVQPTDSIHVTVGLLVKVPVAGGN